MDSLTPAFAAAPVHASLRGRGPRPARSPLRPSPVSAPCAPPAKRVRELMYGAGGAFRGLAARLPHHDGPWSPPWAGAGGIGGAGRWGGSGNGGNDDDHNVDPSWGVAPGVHVILRGRCDAVYAAAVANLVQMSAVLNLPAPLVSDPTVPVVVLLSWMGAQQKQLAKYSQFYENLGYEVHLVFNGLLTAVLPRATREQAQKIEAFVASQPAERPVFVHAFSIGTGVYGMLLDSLRDDLERLERFKERVAGVVFDSGPAPIFPNDVAKGLHTVCPMISKAVWEPVAGLFFRLTQARKAFGASEEALRKGQMDSPQLYFYSLDDKVIPNIHHAIEEFIDKNRQRGVEVYNKFWKNSTHASHLKIHPDEYLANLDSFVKRCMQLRDDKMKALTPPALKGA